MQDVEMALVGAGSRGTTYGRHAVEDHGAAIVAVAEPRPTRRTAAADRFGIDPARCYEDWRQLADQPRLADAVVVATPDRLHTEPTLALIERGYHVLLEKPIAPTLAECERIAAAAERAGIILAVCHVMRYTAYTQALKQLLDRGVLGDIVSVEHLEPVGWWHYAHSYVRGNWRREAESSPMLLAKSCHDIDWLGYVIGRPVERVASFGGLYHFRPEHRPEGAADRCLDCEVEAGCPYSAPRLYRRVLERWDPAGGGSGWPLTVITDDVTPAGVEQALREGPYGRCVYACDNDVVDHQVVTLEYAGGVTASFTMTAFSPLEHRRTRIFGTHGYVDGDGTRLRVVDFRSGADEVQDTAATGGASAASGHGGGDGRLVAAFLAAIAAGEGDGILTGPRESIESHRVVWAAEEARHTGQVVRL